MKITFKKRKDYYVITFIKPIIGPVWSVSSQFLFYAIKRAVYNFIPFLLRKTNRRP